MPKVFVSHSSKDRDYVEREIVSTLRNHGIDTWYSTDNIATADQWYEKIVGGLESCDWFLVVLSSNSVESEWVKDETHWAIDNRKGKIVPVVIEPCNVLKLHLRLQRIQQVDYQTDSETARKNLLSIWDKAVEVDEDRPELTLEPIITNSIGMKLVLIPAGEFVMGSPETEEGHRINEQQHLVRITTPFYMGVYLVTRSEYQKVTGENLGDSGNTFLSLFSNLLGSNDIPADWISWTMASEFCHKLSALDGNHYLLPTEAQWEYACRAGTTTSYHFGDNARKLGKYAWYSDNSGLQTHKVGQKLPNAWGLHDMYGNVAEWCRDRYKKKYYLKSPTEDPTGPTSGAYRVFRGGAFRFQPEYCRSASRSYGDAGSSGDFHGFRVIMEPG